MSAVSGDHVPGALPSREARHAVGVFSSCHADMGTKRGIVMVNIVQSTHDRLVREVANRYIRQGYAVQIEPTDADLPPFLHGFLPDLIVTTPDDKIVVEVKA